MKLTLLETYTIFFKCVYLFIELFSICDDNLRYGVNARHTFTNAIVFETV
ncbi:MAG: hypothetical protein K0B15_05685 [Lentimicrobium sp.]|nr:hypothetical protein [Lentimicrobium sp.]